MTTVWVWVMTCAICGRPAWLDLGGRGWGPHARIDSCEHVIEEIEEYMAGTPQARTWQRRRAGRASSHHVVALEVR